MAVASISQRSHPPAPPSGFMRRWVFSTDHKVIGIQYWGLALVAVFVGMTLSLADAVAARVSHRNLADAREDLPDGVRRRRHVAGVLLSLVTMHGTIMVFFVLTTAPQGGFGNLLPADSNRRRDMAFPTPEHDVVLGDVRRLPGR